MSKPSLTKTSLIGGVWQGLLTDHADEAPVLTVTHLNSPLQDVSLSQTEEGWLVRVPIPASLIADGMQSFVISDATGTVLNSFAILSGDALAEDIRAEVDLLRAELDLLKRAFRRHCVETA